MTTNQPAEAQSKDAASQLHMAHHLTRGAAEILGLDHQAAVQAAVEGALVIDGALVTVAPLSLLMDDGLPGTQVLLMVSVDTGLLLQDLGMQAAAELLAHAPGLLAVYDSTIGCSPDGSITLHRRVKVDELAAADLAHCLSSTRRLTHLLGLEHGIEMERH